MEKVSNEIMRKARMLLEFGKVQKDIDTEKRTYYTVEGDSETHSVIYDKIKKEFLCDCKWSTLTNKKCSHMFAVELKGME
ncbi:MAG: hypothetical protein HYW22_00640 [Candidatus Aenigmarchaeota archaeon]|nr:hypothetical protein [Candidatus Aenigmarchaeota archaeon]